MRNNNVKRMVLCAVLIALSIGLNQIKLLHLPFGGSIRSSPRFTSLSNSVWLPESGLR